MTWLVRFWAWILSWLSSWLPTKGRKPLYKTALVREALPRNLERFTFYLVEDDGYLEQAAMVCPCGCGSTLNMNLLPDERPCWTVTRSGDGAATLYPSIWRKVGCRSHFWFRDGQVFWCESSE